MKFVADHMLGRLAKWLRILGFDTLFLTDVPDEEILKKARGENRIILTRDRALAKEAPREKKPADPKQPLHRTNQASHRKIPTRAEIRTVVLDLSRL